MIAALQKHWPEYLMEAAELCIFMVSACLFGIVLSHPSSPLAAAIPDGVLRRMFMGFAMAATAAAIIYSPWGKQSGAHFNPAVTLTFLRLGKIAPWDATFYILAQFAGGTAGVLLANATLASLVAHPAVNYVATLPGPWGARWAFAAEAGISFVLMTVILAASNTPRLARFTGLFGAACVATFITVEAPISGMSMNPARTFGSALLPNLWDTLWIYFIAPPVGMLLAAALHLRLRLPVGCAKLHHQNSKRCIFCEYQAAMCKVPALATTHSAMKKIAVLSATLFLTVFAWADAKTLLNLDNSGLAIQGYDPVAFFTEKKPVKGKPEFKAAHNGATYQFASAENKALFEKAPAKYEPAFGGYCAYGVSRGALAPIKIEAWQMVNGRLLMQKNESIRDAFNKDPQGNFARANANWPGLVEKKGK
jgi:aquaporin Z